MSVIERREYEHVQKHPSGACVVALVLFVDDVGGA